ncbi:MAG: MFS transporter [Pseudomonadota bacterium]|nr:MAG: hypothetical protein DIU56_11805 [Pseudomonadota bacterium]
MTSHDHDALRQQAWWNVAAGFAVWMLIVAMPAALMPVLYGPIMDETGWSRGEVMLFSTFKFAAGAVAAFFLGHIVDRFGLNRVMYASMAGTGLAIASLLVIESLWAYCAAAAVLGASILGCITCTKVLISRWFAARLGFAVGVALTAAGIAGLIVPLAAAELSASIGWRMTAAIMGCTIFFVLMPFYRWKARETPAVYGVTAEEFDAPRERAVAAAAADTSQQPEFRDLLRSRTFWAVVFVQTLIGAIDHGMNDHLPLYLDRDADLGPRLAAVGFSTVIVAGALGKLGFGWLFDRYSVRAVALCCVLMGVGILLGLGVSGLFTFVLFALVRGASHGGALVDIPVVAKHVFGIRTLSKTIAILSAANSLGAAIGAGGVGFAHDATGSYASSFLALVALSLLAAMLIWRIEPCYWVRGRHGIRGAAAALPAEAPSERFRPTRP